MKRIHLLLFVAACFYSCKAQQTMFAHFLDVGQADATLLQFDCGLVLVDAGAQDQAHTDKLINWLDQFFTKNPSYKKTIETVIITHNHIDHTRALREISEKFTIKNFVDNGQTQGRGTEDPNYIRTVDPITKEEITFEQVTQEGTVKNGYTSSIIDNVNCAGTDPVIKVLSGRFDQNPGWSVDAYDNKNNHSVIVRVDFGEASFLFTGDLEEEAIETILHYYVGSDPQEGNILDVDVYQVGHHGSHNATTIDLLNALTPEFAVISCGKPDFGKNSAYPFTTYNYGHPRESTVSLLKLAIEKRRSTAVDAMVAEGSKSFISIRLTDKIYSTSWDNTIKVKAQSDGKFTVFINQ